MSLMAYVGGAIGLLHPEFYSAFGPHQETDSVQRFVALLMPLAAVYLTPFIFYPCWFDKFPEWLVGRASVDKLGRFAKALGVELDEQQRSE